MNKEKLRILKVAAVVLCLIGLAGGIWSFAIWNQYLINLPRSPDSTTGRVYPLNMHGIVLYQTAVERSRLHTVEYSSNGLFFLGLALGAVYLRLSRGIWIIYNTPQSRKAV